MLEIKEKTMRYKLLDEIRGFWIINMVVYHAVWDFVYLYGIEVAWFDGTFRDIWRIMIRLGFITLSGYCWQMGKKQLTRGIIVFAGGLIVSAVTLIVTPESRIIFGVLTFLGSAMILLVPLSKLLEKIPAMPGVIVSVILFVVTFRIGNGTVGFGNIQLCEVPKGWYANWVTTYLGFPMDGFFTTDYFGFFPWIFLYIAGYYGYTILKKKECVNWAKKGICPPLGFVGRHSLLIYLLHQPLIYGACEALHYFGVI